MVRILQTSSGRPRVWAVVGKNGAEPMSCTCKDTCVKLCDPCAGDYSSENSSQYTSN